MRSQIVLGAVVLTGATILVGQMNVSAVPDGDAPRADASYLDPQDGTIGPDVVYTDCVDIRNWGTVGGIIGYSLGSYTCNIGDMNLLWGTTHGGTPGLAMNAYRLHEGRLVQIGMSWVKHACCAAAGSGCGVGCNGQGGSVLGVGCRDIYSAGWNGGQNRFGPRSDLNPYSGAWQPAPGGGGNAIHKRLQIHQDDINTGNYPGALYFAEGVYVATDDAQWSNWLNNASYKQINVSGSTLSPTGQMYRYDAAIYAWRDHGNGIGNPDNSVEIVEVDIPDEGRLIAGAKAIDLGNGSWRYEYAIFNLNSHRAAGSLHVPTPPGAAFDLRFHDVDYHSGEVYDNTDWYGFVDGSGVTWVSPQSYQENPNSNALRWGTQYNYWFTSTRPPIPGEVTIGLFRPGTPSSVSATLIVPSPGDANTALPTSFNTIFGQQISGSLQDLYESDDSRLVIEQRPAFTPLLPLIRVDITGVAPQPEPSSLTTTVEASATSVPTLPPQKLQLWNDQTGQWDVLDERTATFDDSVVEVTITDDPGRYIADGSNEMTMRLEWFDPGDVFFPAWSARIDQAIWTVEP